MSEGNGRTWSPEIKELGDKLAALAKPQAAELSEYLEQNYHFVGTSGTEALPDQGTPPPPPPVEPTAYNVVIDGVADQTKKLNVIKLVRELVQGLGLKEAKELVDKAPRPVKEGVAPDEAEALKKKLEEAGATVSLKPAS